MKKIIAFLIALAATEAIAEPVDFYLALTEPSPTAPWILEYAGTKYFLAEKPVIPSSEILAFTITTCQPRPMIEMTPHVFWPQTRQVTMQLSLEAACEYNKILTTGNDSIIVISKSRRAILRLPHIDVEAEKKIGFHSGFRINENDPTLVLRFSPKADCISWSLEDQKTPNQAPEPTTMAVTPPAAQESRQP
jgi:hypothetical protein